MNAVPSPRQRPKPGAEAGAKGARDRLVAAARSARAYDLEVQMRQLDHPITPFRPTPCVVRPTDLRPSPDQGRGREPVWPYDLWQQPTGHVPKIMRSRSSARCPYLKSGGTRQRRLVATAPTLPPSSPTPIVTMSRDRRRRSRRSPRCARAPSSLRHGPRVRAANRDPVRRYQGGTCASCGWCRTDSGRPDR